MLRNDKGGKLKMFVKISSAFAIPTALLVLVMKLIGDQIDKHGQGDGAWIMLMLAVIILYGLYIMDFPALVRHLERSEQRK